MIKLDRITLRGFKSIEKLEEFPLGNLNILIGANGAGKSNFVDFFRLLQAMVEERLQLYVSKNGPADGYFHNGIAVTRQIEADLFFGDNRYAFAMEPTAEGKIILAREQIQHAPEDRLTIARGELESVLPRSRPQSVSGSRSGPRSRSVSGSPSRSISGSRSESKDDSAAFGPWEGVEFNVWKAVSSLQVYHFHDTSMTAGMRRNVGVEQSEILQPDASNLAAFLLALRTGHREQYELLRKTLRRIAPYFDDFELRVTKATPQDTVRLTWRRRGTDYVFSPGHFSDGTIRFLCLSTVLLQPSPPTIIVLDEPELGLHPEALSVLGGLIRSASSRLQIILATQSPMLLGEFEPEQVITVDQIDGATRFIRLDPVALAAWLDDYALGELWMKGTIQGGVNNA